MGGDRVRHREIWPQWLTVATVIDAETFKSTDGAYYEWCSCRVCDRWDREPAPTQPAEGAMVPNMPRLHDQIREAAAEVPDIRYGCDPSVAGNPSMPGYAEAHEAWRKYVNALPIKPIAEYIMPPPPEGFHGEGIARLLKYPALCLGCQEALRAPNEMHCQPCLDAAAQRRTPDPDAQRFMAALRRQTEDFEARRTSSLVGVPFPTPRRR